ncbi:MAG: DUF6503 family protein [Saprospiraceae bacterium]|nr:DUF6503 family protein [Saprospiraceae bacterium]
MYLYGLPMKWKDPGVEIDSVATSAKFEGVDCHVIRILYEKDVWHFYRDKSNYALLGEVFYVDEEKQVGERLIRSGEVNAVGIILPQSVLGIHP